MYQTERPCEIGSTHKIQAIEKYFVNTIKKSKQCHFTRFFHGHKKRKDSLKTRPFC